MREHRHSDGVFWLIAVLLFAINLSIMAAGRKIEAQLSRGNSFYLCVETAKLRLFPTLCDEFSSTPNTPDMEKARP